MEENKIYSYLKLIYPKKKVLKLTKINMGLSLSEVYAAFFENQIEGIIIKIYPKTYEERLNNEIKILKYLEITSIPSSKILHYNYNAFENESILIETFIEGDNLFTLLENNRIKDETLNNIGEILSKIHLLKDIDVWQDNEINNFGKDDWIISIKKRNQNSFHLLYS